MHRIFYQVAAHQVRLNVEELAAAGIKRRGKMAKGRYSPDGLISRQAARWLHDSRLIVAIPSQGGVTESPMRTEGNGENGNIHASHSQIRSMHRYDITLAAARKFLRRLSHSGPLTFFRVDAIRKPRGY